MLMRTLLVLITLAFHANSSWRYLSSENSPLRNDNIRDMQKDGMSAIYLLGGNDTLYRYSKGDWKIISLKNKNIEHNSRMFVEHDGTVWLGSAFSGLTKIEGDSTSHYWADDGCIDSAGTIPLGVDKEGKSMLLIGYFYGMGANSKKLARFSVDGECQTVNTGLFPKNELIISSYSRDSVGMEWFQTGSMSDVDRGFGKVYTLKDDSLFLTFSEEFLSTPLHFGTLYSDRIATYACFGSRFVVFQDGDTSIINSIKGANLPVVHCVLRDSRGTLWIGTEGYTFSEEKIGLVKITGADTIILNKENSDFNSYYVKRIVENENGDIWVSTSNDSFSVAIYSYDTPIVQHPIHHGMATYKAENGNKFCFDIRGRLLRGVPRGHCIIIHRNKPVLSGFYR